METHDVRLPDDMTPADFVDRVQGAVRQGQGRETTIPVKVNGEDRSMIITPTGGVPIFSEPPPTWVPDGSDETVFNRFVQAALNGQQAKLGWAVIPPSAQTREWVLRVELSAN
jgi:hypothetical protein